MECLYYGPYLIWILNVIIIFSQLHFHGEDLESLHQHIPAEELPEELGGSKGPLDNTFLLENLKKQEDYFKGKSYKLLLGSSCLLMYQISCSLKWVRFILYAIYLVKKKIYRMCCTQKNK